MSKSKFYIRSGSSLYPFGYTIMQRKAHWWQRERRVADFHPWNEQRAILLRYQLNHEGNMPPIAGYDLQVDVLEQFAPTDPAHAYCVCAEFIVRHGEEEGTEILTMPILPLRDGDPMRVTDVRYYPVSIPIADFVDEDESYARRCAEELLDNLRSAHADMRAYFDRHNKTTNEGQALS